MKCIVFQHRVSTGTKLYNIPENITIHTTSGNNITKICWSCLSKVKSLVINNTEHSFIRFTNTHSNRRKYNAVIVSSEEGIKRSEEFNKRSREEYQSEEEHIHIQKKRKQFNCPGINNPFIKYLPNNTIKDLKTNEVIGIQDTSSITIHSVNCKKSTGKQWKLCGNCQQLNDNVIRFRIKRLKKYLQTDITERPLKPDDPPELLQEYIKEYKKQNEILKSKMETYSRYHCVASDNPGNLPIIKEFTSAIKDGRYTNTFFFHWMTMSFRNFNCQSSNGHRYDNSTLLFAMFLKWYGGKRVIDILTSEGKTHGKKGNLMFPHNKTLKRWSPDWSYGSIAEDQFKELVDSVNTDNRIPIGISWDETDIRTQWN